MEGSLVPNRTFLLLYVSLVTLSIVVNYPGRPNTDTLVMLWEAHNVRDLGSWNSPFCTFFYGLFGPIFGYPFGALIAQSLVLLAWPAQVLGALISISSTKPLTRGICIGLWALVSCCFVALAGELIKDMIFCAFLSLAFFVCGSVECDESLWRLSAGRAAALVAAAVGMALVRPTNLILIAVAGFALFVWCRQSKVLGVIGLTLGVSIAATLCQNWLFAASPGDSYLQTVTYDIAGVSSYEGRDYFSEIAGTQPDIPSITRCYSPKQGDPFMWGDCKKVSQSLQPLGASVIGSWLRLIASHPVGYLVHRARFAGNLLIADDSGTKNIVSVPPSYLTALNTAQGLAWIGRPNLADGLQLWNPTIAYAPFGKIAGLLVGKGWLQQPLVWCAVLLTGFVWSVHRRSSGHMLPLYLLAVVGLSNMVMIVWIGPSDDLRYLYPTWMCALATIALACRNVIRIVRLH
jgi:hypothetical protein